jgi:exopolysaccharide biosynthesis polyprenyl glycosylphosphotransferase
MRARTFETHPAVAYLAAADTKNDQAAALGYSDLQSVGVQASTHPTGGEIRSRAGLSTEIPGVKSIERPLKDWRGIAKWSEDKVLSTILLLATAPLMLFIAILIKVDSRGPALFIQDRFGLNNSVIRVFKFRTMHAEMSDATGKRRTVRNDPRVTRVGRVLRWLSFDELPQLLNVLRGDMSLVGPRAHALQMMAGERLYWEAMPAYQHRHRVKPGITGWAQINGLRGEVDTLEKGRARLAHDLYYIDNWSLWLDLKILMRTVTLLTSEGAY